MNGNNGIPETPKCGASSRLDEQQLLNIMRYYDGECSEFEALQVEKMLRDSSAAKEHYESLFEIGEMLESFADSVSAAVDWEPDLDYIISQANARRNNPGGAIETYNPALNNPDLPLVQIAGLPNQRNEDRGLIAKKSSSFSKWFNYDYSSLFNGLGWASSGAMVAASLFLLFGMNGTLWLSQGTKVSAKTGAQESLSAEDAMPVSSLASDNSFKNQQPLTASLDVELNPAKGEISDGVFVMDQHETSESKDNTIKDKDDKSDKPVSLNP